MFSSIFNTSGQSGGLFQNIESSNTALFSFTSAPIQTESRPDKPKEKPMSDTVFQKMLYSDITFLVDDKEFQAHKGILATRCKFFEDLFASDVKESNDKVIKLEGISKVAFLSNFCSILNSIISIVLLKFIYCEEDLDLSEDPALELLPLVNSRYSLPVLGKKLEDFLAEIVDLNNYVRIVKVAESLENDKLKNAVLDFMGSKISVITKSHEIMNVSKEILVELLSRATFGKAGFPSNDERQTLSSKKARKKQT